MSNRLWLILGGIAALFALGCVGILAVLFITGAVTDNDEEGGKPPARQTEIARNTAEPRTSIAGPNVTYRIITTGNQRIQLTYENATGNTEQTTTTTQDATWEKSFRAEEGAFLYVSAQLGDAIGSIDCEIEVNGDVVERAHSSGAFSIATCSGSLPRE